MSSQPPAQVPPPAPATVPAPTPAPAPNRIRWLASGVLLLILVGGGIWGYSFWQKLQTEKALAANLRGVGLMEQHKFPDAEKEFAEAVRLAPDWNVAKINLGIAMLNQQPTDSKKLTAHVEQAKELFRTVLKLDPDNPHAHYCLGTLAFYVGERAEAYEHFAAVNRVDPNDPHTWLRVGATHPDGESSPAARDCYEKALKLDPYLNEARYRLAMIIRETDPARQTAAPRGDSKI